MPTYAYACTACEHRFEIFQSFTEDSLTECPECHGRLRKVFNAVGVVFKGSGFYRTDSRNDRNRSHGGHRSTGKDSSHDSGSASAPATSSESTSSSSDSSSSATSDSSTSKTASTSVTKSEGTAA